MAIWIRRARGEEPRAVGEHYRPAGSLLAGGAIEEFACGISVTRVTRRFVGQVKQHPSQVSPLLDLAWLVERQ